MTDQEKWDTAIAAVSGEFAQLPDAVKDLLRPRLENIKRLKTELHSFGLLVSGPVICASCGGECCRVGKYHFTVIDLIVHLGDGLPLFRPRFSADACPFLGESGCMMEPSYRPYNCVTFNCDRIHHLLASSEQASFTAAEQKLRLAYNELEELADNRFMHGLIITCERDLLPRPKPVLRFADTDSSRRTDNG